MNSSVMVFSYYNPQLSYIRDEMRRDIINNEQDYAYKDFKLTFHGNLYSAILILERR